MSRLFDLPTPEVAIAGGGAFPVRRIVCVGRNYAEHAREMGGNPEREPPFFFSKPADALVPGEATIPFPARTANLHHEIELVVALGAGGANVASDAAMDLVFGYAVGNDLTRRDLQAKAKAMQRSWDLGKNFEGAAVLAPLTPARDFQPGGQRIHLAVNGVTRQDSAISDMVWSIPEIIADLSLYYHLAPGDLIMTGTPAGVGALLPGDRVTGGVEGLVPVDLTIGPAE